MPSSRPTRSAISSRVRPGETGAAEARALRPPRRRRARGLAHRRRRVALRAHARSGAGGRRVRPASRDPNGDRLGSGRDRAAVVRRGQDRVEQPLRGHRRAIRRGSSRARCSRGSDGRATRRRSSSPAGASPRAVSTTAPASMSRSRPSAGWAGRGSRSSPPPTRSSAATGPRWPRIVAPTRGRARARRHLRHGCALRRRPRRRRATLGGGPAIFRGPTVHPRVFELLVEAARAEGIELHRRDGLEDGDGRRQRLRLAATGSRPASSRSRSGTCIRRSRSSSSPISRRASGSSSRSRSCSSPARTTLARLDP